LKQKGNNQSAVPGRIGPEYDLEAIKQRAIVDTMERLTKPMPKIEEKRDGRDWARRIMARVGAGESVGLAVEMYAREALGLPAPGSLGE